jgi:hypothetical protein
VPSRCDCVKLGAAGLERDPANHVARRPFAVAPDAENMDAAKAPEHPKANAMETTARVATRKKAWRYEQRFASWSAKRRRSRGMLCNVAGKSGLQC